MDEVKRLAQEGHGAIEVEAAKELPLRVFLAGPIKHWWSLSDDEWGTGIHGRYCEWRDAVEAALVKAGFLVISAHKMWRGAWHEEAQKVNDYAIKFCDVMVVLTPPGIPANGTEQEVLTAVLGNTEVVMAPPGDVHDLNYLIAKLQEKHKGCCD